MIKKLKIRFIVLAMVSLTVLLSLIVAGMNIANYRNVVNSADQRIEVLEENSARLFGGPGMGMQDPFGGFENGDDDLYGGLDDDDFDDGRFFGPGGAGGPSMSRDEAEESRFFTVILDSSGNVRQANVDRIYSIDASEAEEMAKTAAASDEDEGFIDDFRYSVDEENGVTRVTFLDCGRTLETFRDFLKASVLMSLLGLLLVFFVILYFAGRIVRPVAESYGKQKRFITDAGHEIKTPLAIIKANLDLMDMELDSAESTDGPADIAKTAGELRESLGDINDQVVRLTDLTNDLVYLSRMEEGESQFRMIDFPVSDVVSEAAQSFQAPAKVQDKAFQLRIQPMLTLRGDEKAIRQLVGILLDNALKYTPEGGSISLSLDRQGKGVRLNVTNTAEAIDEKNLEHLFDRFYRADASRNSKTGGYGIGLSIAQAIVTAHRGKISAATKDGQSLSITATLPGA